MGHSQGQPGRGGGGGSACLWDSAPVPSHEDVGGQLVSLSAQQEAKMAKGEECLSPYGGGGGGILHWITDPCRQRPPFPRGGAWEKQHPVQGTGSSGAKGEPRTCKGNGRVWGPRRQEPLPPQLLAARGGEPEEQGGSARGKRERHLTACALDKGCLAGLETLPGLGHGALLLPVQTPHCWRTGGSRVRRRAVCVGGSADGH